MANRKKRKDDAISRLNNVRRLGIIKLWVKVSEDAIQNINYELLYQQLIKESLNKYKRINLSYTQNIKIGYNDDDFINALVTVIFCITAKVISGRIKKLR